VSSGCDPSLERLLSEQAERTLVRLDTGGFRLQAADAETIHVVASGDDWRAEGKGPWDGWILSRETSDQGGGLRLEAEGRWVGRTLAFSGHSEVPGLRHVLLADGRLFRMVLCNPRRACFELRSWETSGAYFAAQPIRDGWILTATPAGAAMDDVEALQILFAAEINQSDSEQRPASPR
jgi:hypothetical protein